MKLTIRHYLTTILIGTALTVFGGAAIAQNRGGDDHGRHDDNKGEYHFRQEDKSRFSSHYKSNIRQMQQHPDKRHHLRAGEQLPNDYRSHLKAVPSSYYRSVPPPPPGYKFGYYDGYVVAYNPTTRVVADVLDLVDAAINH